MITWLSPRLARIQNLTSSTESEVLNKVQIFQYGFIKHAVLLREIIPAIECVHQSPASLQIVTTKTDSSIIKSSTNMVEEADDPAA